MVLSLGILGITIYGKILKHTESMCISSFHHTNEFLINSIPYESMSIVSIKRNLMVTRKVSKSCIGLAPRTPIVLDKKPKILLMLPSTTHDIESLLAMLHESMTLCPDEVRPGLYHPSNIIIMDVSDAASAEQDMVEKNLV